MPEELVVSDDFVKNKSYSIRGKQVMLDRELAELYGVEARRLREQVKRNIERFPSDFMFQINIDEYKFMVSQNATPSLQQLGGHLPYVFTEQGVAMLSGVLKSMKAINLYILSYINRYNMTSGTFMQNKNIMRYPRLDTVLTVEDFIKANDGAYKKRKLWESLPKKMMYQTFQVIINYLLYSKKISIDSKGKIGWIYYPEMARKYYDQKELGRKK